MGSGQDTRQEGPSRDEQEREPARGGHSGEGSASALAQLKKQDRQQRRQNGDADDEGPGR